MTTTVAIAAIEAGGDTELMSRIAAGDRAAFASLYRREQHRVYRFAVQMSGSVPVAEDVTQETFLVLMREAGRYDAARGSIGAFLYGIARNQVLRALARSRSQVPFDEESDAEPVDPGNPLAALTDSEAVEAVRQAVLSLPAQYREAVVLCDLHEQSYAEAAVALGVAVGTVRSRLHRARSLLNRKLAGQRKGGRA